GCCIYRSRSHRLGGKRGVADESADARLPAIAGGASRHRVRQGRAVSGKVSLVPCTGEDPASGAAPTASDVGGARRGDEYRGYAGRDPAASDRTDGWRPPDGAAATKGERAGSAVRPAVAGRPRLAR